MRRRDFLKAVVGVVVGAGFAPEVLAEVAKIPPTNRSEDYDAHIKDYLHKMRNFNVHHDGDIRLERREFDLLKSCARRFERVQLTVGHGNFYLLSLDEAISIARSYSRVGEFTRAEMDFLEMIFYFDASHYGFFGNKPVKNITDGVKRREVAKTLTYYAVKNLKPAFGIEVSKNFPTHKRAYYHLKVLETYMDLLGIEYERSFSLSANGVKGAIYNNVKLAFYDNRIFLDVTNARKRLGYIPFRKSAEIVYRPSNPLIALVESDQGYRVFHGNRRITRICPEYFEYDFSTEGINIQIDGEERKATFGDMLGVQESFMVMPKKGCRVNVIGFKKTGISDESGVMIGQEDVMKRFSVDKSGNIFRVEVYKDDKFSGMVLVNFTDENENLIASEPSNVSSFGLSAGGKASFAEDSPTSSGEGFNLGR